MSENTRNHENSNSPSSAAVESYVAEDERKFLLDSLPDHADNPDLIDQYYLQTGNIELRVRHREDSFLLTLKVGGSTQNRIEVEKEISQTEFNSLKNNAVCKITKKRYTIRDGVTIDEFLSQNLLLVEVESPAVVPDWVGEEVTGNPSFYNANMAEAT